MKRIYTLKKKKEFDFVFGNGKKLSSKNFTIYYLKSNNFCYGIIVSKKNYKEAYKRNKVRRQLRQIINENKFEQSLFTIVIVVKKEYLDNDFLLIKNEFCSKIKLIMCTLRSK